MVVVQLLGSSVVEDEADLVARAQHDRQDFAVLYRQYLPRIYAYCYRRLGSQDAAEDATSQIFTQALAALPRFQRGSFRAWLFTIAHNVVVDELRRSRPVASLDAGHELADRALELEDVATRVEAEQTIATLMSQLSPAQQQVLELRLAGLTAVEIASVMGRSHGTIRNLHHQTLVRLRELLGVGRTDERLEHVS
jgi:RNA polymerase sigma-70 factor (ECF subfamily)